MGGDKKLLLLRFAFSTGLFLCLSASYCMVIVRLAAKRIIG
ncbi:putative membrane protein [Bacteroides fragilis str. 3986 N(B)22]|nr:putative membrane protein [Bacteroides fragilis str. 3986 N(B)22]